MNVQAISDQLRKHESMSSDLKAMLEDSSSLLQTQRKSQVQSLSRHNMFKT